MKLIKQKRKSGDCFKCCVAMLSNQSLKQCRKSIFNNSNKVSTHENNYKILKTYNINYGNEPDIFINNSICIPKNINLAIIYIIFFKNNKLYNHAILYRNNSKKFYDPIFKRPYGIKLFQKRWIKKYQIKHIFCQKVY